MAFTRSSVRSRSAPPNRQGVGGACRRPVVASEGGGDDAAVPVLPAPTRRAVIGGMAAAASALGFGVPPGAAQTPGRVKMQTRPIPSSGEALPVIGLPGVVNGQLVGQPLIDTRGIAGGVNGGT